MARISRREAAQNLRAGALNHAARSRGREAARLSSRESRWIRKFRVTTILLARSSRLSVKRAVAPAGSSLASARIFSLRGISFLARNRSRNQYSRNRTLLRNDSSCSSYPPIENSTSRLRDIYPPPLATLAAMLQHSRSFQWRAKSCEAPKKGTYAKRLLPPQLSCSCGTIWVAPARRRAG